MHKRMTPRECEHYSKNWALLGSGSMGGKAQMLYDHSLVIEQAGFTPNPRAVLRMDFAESYKDRNGLLAAKKEGRPIDELRAMAGKGAFSNADLRLLRQILGMYPGQRLAVRSSAHGDADGTGVYESGYFLPTGNAGKDMRAFARLVRQVIASEFTRDAVAYQKDFNLEPGMAVMVEPLIGRSYDGLAFSKYDYEYHNINGCGDRSKPPLVYVDLEERTELLFAPNMAGNGFTSTALGPAVINLVFGLPVTAVRQGGMKITLFPETAEIEMRHLRIAFEFCDEFKRVASAAAVINSRGELITKESDVDSAFQRCGYDTNHLSLEGLRLRVEKLERLLGAPKYFEWARVLDAFGLRNGKIYPDPRTNKERYLILQLADVNRKKEWTLFPENPEHVLLTSNVVRGEGSKVCATATYCEGPQHIERLDEYNATHKGYLLFISDGLVRSIKSERVTYGMMNNAGVVVACGEGDMHSAPAMTHFDELARKRDVLIMHVFGHVRLLMHDLARRMGLDVPTNEVPKTLEVRTEAMVSEAQGKGLLRHLPGL